MAHISNEFRFYMKTIFFVRYLYSNDTFVAVFLCHVTDWTTATLAVDSIVIDVAIDVAIDVVIDVVIDVANDAAIVAGIDAGIDAVIGIVPETVAVDPKFPQNIQNS